MGASVRGLLGTRGSARALVLVASGAALLSAFFGAYEGLQRMDRARDEYGPLDQAGRESQIEVALGFDSATWERVRSLVHADDRFAVVSDAPEQHEVRNYAGYSLLPAIQVPAAEATVVIHYAREPPAEPRCLRLDEKVCVQRRRP
jgi:hypothetical protein